MRREFNPFKQLAVGCARAAYDKKAEDVVLVDVRKSSIVADFMLLVSVTSPAHLEAVQAAIEDVMEPSGIELRHRDGSHSALWRVLDYGGLLVHLMHQEARHFYGLDKLYHDQPKQRWMPVARKAKAG
ncbi:MAG: ribosome silencing factor [Elusimicrobia bacterium]|nr:ribosome silencing factor [Elusimicrobiota bacterium]